LSIYVADAVPDTKAKKTYITSAYQNKNDTSSASAGFWVSPLLLTSDNGVDSTGVNTDNNVPRKGESVNGKQEFTPLSKTALGKKAAEILDARGHIRAGRGGVFKIAGKGERENIDGVARDYLRGISSDEGTLDEMNFEDLVLFVEEARDNLVGVHFNQAVGNTTISSIRILFNKDNSEWRD
jgi:hypothetical protein